MVTYWTEYSDVANKFTASQNQSNFQFPDQAHCSFLLKLTEYNLYVSHTTWTGYTDCLKAYKHIEVNLQNPLVRTKKMSLSALVGSIGS